MTDDLIQPTAEEMANGWTAETLTEYVREREGAQENSVNWKTRPVKRPLTANSKYNPHHWRSA